jgi:hypothetical protein
MRILGFVAVLALALGSVGGAFACDMNTAKSGDVLASDSGKTTTYPISKPAPSTDKRG